MPQFHIKSAYELPDRRVFALSGRVVEGEVRVGMFIDFTRGVSCRMGPIHAIEFPGQGAPGEMCLLFKCDNEMELSLWRSLIVPDELVSVFESHEIGGID
jgi:hypothetical protein